MLDIIRTRDNKKVIDAMIEGRQESVWSIVKKEREELNFNEESLIIDEWGVSIKTHIFMNTMLDIDDDFAQTVNEILYTELEKDNADDILDILEERYDIDLDGYMCGSGYTYNDPDHCHLDRDIVYHIFEYDMEHYALIQVHHGADARVGFGVMVCFKINEIDYFYLGMDYDIYDHKTDEDYCKFGGEVGYDADKKKWVVLETGNEVTFYTSADGY